MSKIYNFSLTLFYISVRLQGLLVYSILPWGRNNFFGDFLGLYLLIFFVNNFCLQNKLVMLVAVIWSKMVVRLKQLSCSSASCFILWSGF